MTDKESKKFFIDLVILEKARAERIKDDLQANLEKAYVHNEDECKRCMTKVEAEQSLLLEETEKRVRQETAEKILKDLLALIINNENFSRSVFGWSTENIKSLIKLYIKNKYGVEVEE